MATTSYQALNDLHSYIPSPSLVNASSLAHE